MLSWRITISKAKQRRKKSSGDSICRVITAAHTIIYSQDAEATRAFLRDALGFDKFVDAGDGWLIFAMPPPELAVHPDEHGGRHELYLMCDDITATVDALKAKGVEF